MKTAGKALRGKVAVITGASRGIGLAIAQALAGEGCRLVVSSRSAVALKRASRKFPNDTLARACDVRDAADLRRFFAAVQKQFGRVDILVNNAGVAGPMADVGEIDPAVWDEVIGTNLTGLFLCTQAALPLMSNGATIVNNLSVSSERVFAGQAAYNSAKHGALGFTKTLRKELRPRGIRVVALLPGAVDTDIWQQFWPEAPRERMMSPQVIADMVVAALKLPANATVEHLVIGTTAGAL